MFKFSQDEIRSLQDRKLPFAASFHGVSTIIIDAEGRWATGQVPQYEAETLARWLTARVRLMNKEGK